MRRPLLALASLLVVPFAVYACSDDDKPTATGSVTGDAAPPPAVEAGGPVDSSKPDTAEASGDQVQVRCTQAEFDKAAGAGGGDFTAFPGADITFPMDPAPAQYTNHCVKVKAGSNVTFAGSFTSHPLEPMGGDQPTPIPTQNVNPPSGAVVVTFATAGTFGFECNFHPELMFGAVQVVP